MKKLFFLSLVTVLAGCAADPLEISKAKKVVEELIVTIDKGDYASLNDYYSPNFNASEPAEVREKKLATLKKVMGELQAYQLIDSATTPNMGMEGAIRLTYKIHHTRVTSIETFNVVYEEGGYRVSGHDVKSEGLE